MKKSYFTLSLLLSVFALSAQMPGGIRGLAGQGMSIGHFYGKIVDAVSNKPLESISIQLIQTKLDSVSKKRKDVVVAGMLTDKKGAFSLENLPVGPTFKLKITGIGYKTIEQKAFFEIKMGNGGDMSSMLNGVDKDLGNIRLESETKQLAEVNVTSSKSLLTLGIDRKVFNVDKSLTSAGGTAIDVMKNVPSVNVDIDGNVSLRNAPPQIFVDGRPTTLTLEQIPADAIQSVEIITNPSAKFDASGGGSGILNIVLKKNRKAGYNGSIRANLDSRLKYGLGGDLNVKQGKINFFANTMYNQRKSLSTGNTTRTDYLQKNGSTFLLQNRQYDAPVNSGYFLFGRAGIDYFVDIRNTLTLAGSMATGKFNSVDDLNINTDTNYIPFQSGFRNTNGSFSFRNYGNTLSYKHNFAKSGKEFTADANYNYSKNDNNNFLITQYFMPNSNPKGPMVQQHIMGGGSTKYFTSQADFVNPVTDKIKIEHGARASFRDFTSTSATSFFDPSTGTFIPAPSFSSDYNFQDQVFAAYTTYSQQVKTFSFQAGLRAESSHYTGALVSKNQKFENQYPLSLFPSLFLSKKLNDKQDLQLNYSRKINRPNFFQLIPYIDSSDILNWSKGNPDLVPEFTKLAELSYQVDLNKGNNLLATIYYKKTDNLITRYQFNIKNPAGGGDSVKISSYANANNSQAYGLELTSKLKPATFWDITANVNFYNSKINGSNIRSDLVSDGFSWFGKLNNTFKLPHNYSIQLTGDYQSKTILPASGGGRGQGGGGMFFGGGQLSTVNGYIKPNYGFEMAVRKDFLKNNAASLTLSMNDILRTKLSRTHAESADYVQDNERRRDPQILRLNFNWRFGKFDVSLFKRKNLKGEMEGIQNGMQGAQ